MITDGAPIETWYVLSNWTISKLENAIPNTLADIYTISVSLLNDQGTSVKLTSSIHPPC